MGLPDWSPWSLEDRSWTQDWTRLRCNHPAAHGTWSGTRLGIWTGKWLIYWRSNVSKAISLYLWKCVLVYIYTLLKNNWYRAFAEMVLFPYPTWNKPAWKAWVQIAKWTGHSYTRYLRVLPYFSCDQPAGCLKPSIGWQEGSPIQICSLL